MFDFFEKLTISTEIGYQSMQLSQKMDNFVGIEFQSIVWLAILLVFLIVGLDLSWWIYFGVGCGIAFIIFIGVSVTLCIIRRYERLLTCPLFRYHVCLPKISRRSFVHSLIKKKLRWCVRLKCSVSTVCRFISTTTTSTSVKHNYSGSRLVHYNPEFVNFGFCNTLRVKTSSKVTLVEICFFLIIMYTPNWRKENSVQINQNIHTINQRLNFRRSITTCLFYLIQICKKEKNLENICEEHSKRSRTFKQNADLIWLD